MVRLALGFALLSLLSGCEETGDVKEDPVVDPGENLDGDIDQDGFTTEAGDCDDNDASVNPAAVEICNGIDDDCDLELDEDVQQEFYQDFDEDGFGDGSTGTFACEAPAGYVATGTDCDDGEAMAYPGAPEICDDLDNDCDSVIDNGVTTTFYADADGDTFGDSQAAIDACDAPVGYVLDNTDCNDSTDRSYPGNLEMCDEIDNNCDGSVDEGVTTTYYADRDGDAFGDLTLTQDACSAPTGYVDNPRDCDDAVAAVNPSAAEVCNNVDDNCDGTVDEDTATDARTWYADADADSYGDASRTDVSCAQPSGFVANDDDCDDRRAQTNPAATEYCNTYDDDCDGSTDEDAAADAGTWYMDADSDGYGNASITDVSCAQPTGYVGNDDDCNDGTSRANPGATEVCDTLDNDCDGSTDEDSAADARTWYRDADADSYGNASITDVECNQPSGYVSNDDDCDDGRAASYPSAPEYCNTYDDDCDGTVDEDASLDVKTWYQDADSDTYGNASVTDIDCDQPSGYVTNDDDCLDTRAASYPGATEYCNTYDDDCDGTVDEDAAVDAATWYRDSDGDAYGSASVTDIACTQPSGYVSNDDDCNDGTNRAYPGAAEYCDSLDNDCDGTTDEDSAVDATTWYRDADADNYGNASVTDVECSRPSGYVSNDDDCDDGRAATYPGAAEYCNSYDDDCDGTTDEDAALDVRTWYQDADSDTYGNASVTDINCSQPSGYVSNDDDCLDSRALSNPAATEYCNGYDDDCDGTVDESAAADAVTYYRDADGDSYGSAATTSISCSTPSGYVTNDDDCLDTSAISYPGASEICDSLDNDCDGTADDSPIDGTTYYADVDADGFGDPDNTDSECSLPSGYADNAYDCNDSDATEPRVADIASGSASGTGTLTRPFDSIQDAIDDANECVVVYAGTYTEEIDLDGKSLDLWGVEGEDSTIIDANLTTCSSANPTACGSTVTVASNSNAAPTIHGFTITGGTGTVSSTTSATTCADSSASHNGRNTCTVTTYEYCGGGVYVSGDDPIFYDVVIRDNVLPDFEQATIGSFTQYWLYSYGGGACLVNSNADFSMAMIEGNYADQGGGLYAEGGSSFTFEQGYVSENDATDGAGVNLAAATASFTNAILACNDASTDGGGLFTETSGAATYTNTVFYGNTSSTSGSTRGSQAYIGSSTTFYLYNSIVQASTSVYALYGAGSGTLTYNNVYNTPGSGYGGTLSAGVGSISSGSNFTSASCDGNAYNDDFSLKSTSSSRNAGNSSASYNDADGSRNDQGAFGGPNGSWDL